ncbi:MAG: hypothetical protein V7K70_25045 [Nostoc sp.]
MVKLAVEFFQSVFFHQKQEIQPQVSENTSDTKCALSLSKVAFFYPSEKY